MTVKTFVAELVSPLVARTVMSWLAARGRGFVVRAGDIPTVVPIVPQAILFDLLNGLADALWQHYELEITELTMAQRNQCPANQQAFDFDDDLPF